MQAVKSGRHPALKEYKEDDRGEHLIPSSDFYMHSCMFVHREREKERERQMDRQIDDR